MSEIDFEDYRKVDGDLDLILAYMDVVGDEYHHNAIAFLSRVSEMNPIKSRQIAAVAIAHAEYITQTESDS